MRRLRPVIPRERFAKLATRRNATRFLILGRMVDCPLLSGREAILRKGKLGRGSVTGFHIALPLSLARRSHHGEGRNDAQCARFAVQFLAGTMHQAGMGKNESPCGLEPDLVRSNQ